MEMVESGIVENGNGGKSIGEKWKWWKVEVGNSNGGKWNSGNSNGGKWKTPFYSFII